MYADVTASHRLDHDIVPSGYHMPDPLDPDMVEDIPLIVTRRRLVRLALVAAETGARFQRESLEHDPVAWLLSPREIFDGRDGIEGALGLQGCLRAIILHGLAIGLDADPAAIDDLLADTASPAEIRPLVA